MTWRFDRDGQSLRCDISRDASGSYRIAVMYPDGRESVETIDAPTALVERTVEVMARLKADGWAVSG